MNWDLNDIERKLLIIFNLPLVKNLFFLFKYYQEFASHINCKDRLKNKIIFFPVSTTDILRARSYGVNIYHCTKNEVFH